MATSTIIDFDVTPEERATIERIAARALAHYQRLGVSLNQVVMEMDLTATHRNGCPLQLDALLVADDLNFAHDIGGIIRHLDRRTGQLTACFEPRYAAAAQET